MIRNAMEGIKNKEFMKTMSKRLNSIADMMDAILEGFKHLENIIQDASKNNFVLMNQQIVLESSRVEDSIMITHLHQEIIQLKAHLQIKNQGEFDRSILENCKKMCEVYEKRIQILNYENTILKHYKIDAITADITNLTKIELHGIKDFYVVIHENLANINEMMTNLTYSNNVLYSNNLEDLVQDKTKHNKEKLEKTISYKNDQIAAQEEIINGLKRNARLAAKEKILMLQNLESLKEKYDKSSHRLKEELQVVRNQLHRVERAKAMEIEGYKTEIRLLKKKYNKV